VTEINEVLFSHLPCQMVKKINKFFLNHLCHHYQGPDVTGYLKCTLGIYLPRANTHGWAVSSTCCIWLCFLTDVPLDCLSMYPVTKMHNLMLMYCNYFQTFELCHMF